MEEDEACGQQGQWPQSFLGLPWPRLHSVAVPVDLPLLWKLLHFSAGALREMMLQTKENNITVMYLFIWKDKLAV